MIRQIVPDNRAINNNNNKFIETIQIISLFLFYCKNYVASSNFKKEGKISNSRGERKYG